MKKIKAIEHKNGKVVLNMCADEGNADWLRSARLLNKGSKEVKGLKKKLTTPMYTQE